jgi:hypothetical protein
LFLEQEDYFPEESPLKFAVLATNVAREDRRDGGDRGDGSYGRIGRYGGWGNKRVKSMSFVRILFVIKVFG